MLLTACWFYLWGVFLGPRPKRDNRRQLWGRGRGKSIKSSKSDQEQNQNEEVITISGIPLSTNHGSVLSKFYRLWYCTNFSEAASCSITQLDRAGTPSKPTSTFTPDTSNHNRNIFLNKWRARLSDSCTSMRKRDYNFSKEKIEALKCLSTNTNIVNKRAGEGGAVVVRGRDEAFNPR